MELNLSKKKVLISGGAVGIGRAIALDLAKEGAHIFITTRSETKLLKTLQELQTVSDGHEGLCCQLTNENELSKLIQKVNNFFGNIDILINNAGSTLGITDPYCSIDDWRNVFRLNLEVPIELCNAFIPFMKQQDWGRIINIASLGGLENSGPVTYCASKAALIAYTRSMGRILAMESNNVVMTSVLPGVVATEDGHWGGKYDIESEHAQRYLKERCPLGRFGSPDEISSFVTYLCSEKTTFTHGGIHLVDAGQAKHYMYNSYI